MRCLAACQTELAIRMLDEILLRFEVEFLVESKPLARRLHDSGLNVVFGDLKRTDTSRPTSPQGPASWSRTTAGRASAKFSKRSGMPGHAGLRSGRRHLAYAQARGRAQGAVPNSTTWPSRNSSVLLTEFSRSLTRLKVQRTSGFQRRRPGPHPLAQRSGPRRACQRAGAS